MRNRRASRQPVALPSNVPTLPRKNLLSRLRDKLQPSRFPISPKTAAIVGYILGEHLVDPPIIELIITSDGYALARVEEQVGCDTFIGTYADVYRNWMRVLQVADLTPDEYMGALACFASTVGFRGRATA